MNERAKYLAEGQPQGDPTPITDVLGTVMERASAQLGSNLMRVREQWDGVAGTVWAGTTPVAIRDGVLVVEVPDGSRASVLRFEVDALLARLEADVGRGVATEVRLRVARPSKTERMA